MTETQYQDRIAIADPYIGTEEKTAVEQVLDSGSLASGEEVERFESEFASFSHTSHGIATSNGTTALHAALHAAGIGPGDRVVTTPFTFIATANAIRFTGAEPVFADIDPQSYNIDPQSVESTIQAHDGEIDALLVVHLYGHPVDMDALSDIAARYDIPVIEDAAQAHGATHRGKPVGSLGDVGCFSFYPTKNMTTGEGGMVVTDNDEIAARTRQFIDHGRSDRYEHERLGHNFRMTNVAAAIGRSQLQRLPLFVHERRQNAMRLYDGLQDCSFSLPREAPRTTHAYHQFTIRSERRDELKNHLDEFGIDTGVYYPIPVHEQPAYAEHSVSAPAAERASDEVLSIPVHPQLSDDELNAVITALEYFDSYL